MKKIKVHDGHYGIISYDSILLSGYLLRSTSEGHRDPAVLPATTQVFYHMFIICDSSLLWLRRLEKRAHVVLIFGQITTVTRQNFDGSWYSLHSFSFSQTLGDGGSDKNKKTL